MSDFERHQQNCRQTWHDPENGVVEHEIEWTQFYIRGLYRSIEFHERRLADLLEIQAWWRRFIHYCHTGK